MLYQYGPVTLDTMPFNADEVDHRGQADFAEKPVIGAVPTLEFMGDSNETIEIRGSILPGRIGGLDELTKLADLRRAGNSAPLMRGDGVMMGWFVLTDIRQRHGALDRNGVGFTVEHTLTLKRSDPSRAAANLVSDILSLFGLRGG